MDKNKTTYLGPFIAMVFLFFIVGFLTTANTQFQVPLKETFLAGAGSFSNTCGVLIVFSWFLAYPFFGGVASRWISSCGYKGTLLRGLLVMIVGMGLFSASSKCSDWWPQAVISFGADVTVQLGFIIFLLGSFVVGASATILQVVINPYLTACSVRGTQAVQRLAIGGTANSVGTTIAPWFVAAVIFGAVPMSEIKASQLSVPFLMLIAAIAVVMVMLYFMPLPDIEGTHTTKDSKPSKGKSVWAHRHFTLGVAAIFFYVGAEVCIGGNLNNYAAEIGIAEADYVTMTTIYWGLMLVGRLVGSTLNKVSPRTQLTISTTLALILTALAVALSNPWLLVTVGFFHSIMWGCIFTLSVDGLGELTSIASGRFMIGVLGGAIIPLLQGILADALQGWGITWILVILCEAFMLFYALRGSIPVIKNTNA